MNAKQYAEYEQSVQGTLEGMESRCLIDAAPWFSWLPCGICKRPEGGNRHSVHGTIDRQIIQFDACDDCAYYVVCGRLDDMTMAGIECAA